MRGRTCGTISMAVDRDHSAAEPRGGPACGGRSGITVTPPRARTPGEPARGSPPHSGQRALFSSASAKSLSCAEGAWGQNRGPSASRFVRFASSIPAISSRHIRERRDSQASRFPKACRRQPLPAAAETEAGCTENFSIIAGPSFRVGSRASDLHHPRYHSHNVSLTLALWRFSQCVGWKSWRRSRQRTGD